VAAAAGHRRLRRDRGDRADRRRPADARRDSPVGARHAEAMGRYIASELPHNAVLVSMIHSGSVNC
jgi:hypothetical protein